MSSRQGILKKFFAFPVDSVDQGIFKQDIRSNIENWVDSQEFRNNAKLEMTER